MVASPRWRRVKFITFFLAYYNCTNRVLKYINAGHNHPILTDGKTAKHLNKGCIGLGMFEEFADYILGTEFRIGSVFLLLVLILVYRRFKLSKKREYLK